jgi:phage shock protein PspC (stress-responsive transcriptional regulator)
MVRAADGDQDRDMTETPGTQEPPTSTPPVTGPQPGIDREHLRSYEQLRRSTTDRKVAGVAGGLGRHLDIDPTVVRVLFVVLCFFGGAGFLLYGVAWLVVPEDGRDQGKLATRPGTRNGVLIATALVAALLAVANGWGGPGFPWPVLLVGLGVVVYLAVRDRDGSTTGTAQPPTYDPQPPAYDQQPLGAAGEPPAPPWLPAPPAPAPYQPPRSQRGPLLFGPTLALVAVALGVLGLFDASGGSVQDSAYPALALAVVAVMLLVGAFVGRAGGLILLGVVAALALAATSVAGAAGGFDGDGRRQVRVVPASAAGVPGDYTVNSGRVRVDLSTVRDPQALDGRVIDLHGGAAELVVVLPPGVRSHVEADIDGPGQIDLPDQSTGGIDNALSGTYGSGATDVTITTHLSVGHIDVRNP